MLPSASSRCGRPWRNPVIIRRWRGGTLGPAPPLRVTLLSLLSAGRLLRLWEGRAAQSLHHGHHHRHSHRNHLHHLLRALPGLQLPRQVSAHAVRAHGRSSAPLTAAAPSRCRPQIDDVQDRPGRPPGGTQRGAGVLLLFPGGVCAERRHEARDGGQRQHCGDESGRQQ